MLILHLLFHLSPQDVLRVMINWSELLYPTGTPIWIWKFDHAWFAGMGLSLLMDAPFDYSVVRLFAEDGSGIKVVILIKYWLVKVHVGVLCLCTFWVALLFRLFLSIFAACIIWVLLYLLVSCELWLIIIIFLVALSKLRPLLIRVTLGLLGFDESLLLDGLELLCKGRLG